MPQLRIGFLADDWAQVEPWAHRLVAQIHTDTRFEILALITSGQCGQKPKPNWLYRLINPLEKSVFGRAIPSDTSTIKKISTKNAEFMSSDIEAISALALDVIICVGSHVDLNEMTGLTRYGIWFPDEIGHADDISALSAVTGREAVADIGLNRYVQGDGDAQRIATARINPKFLLSRNALFMKEKLIVLILRELRRLARTGEVALEAENVKSRIAAPGTSALIQYYFGIFVQFARRAYAVLKRRTGIRPDKYILLTGEGNILDFDPKTATKIVPKGNTFWADPFLWERDGKMYCFYEYFGRPANVGHIQVGEFVGDQIKVIGDALKTDIHLSFPFLFEDKGEIYMMPETCAAKRIEIWRCIEFPLKWDLHSTALEGESVADSTILRRDGKWWLFANIATDVYADNCSELHIFEIDGPDLNVVTPHVGNPVSMDSRTARNAGRFHEVDGRLFRPSQDNAYGQYGYGLNIMEITALSLDTYEERLERRISPQFDRRFSGCHHLDVRNGRFVIDALRR